MADSAGTPVEQFYANARLGATQWWRWVVGFLAIAVAWIGIGAIGIVLAGCELIRATNIFGLNCKNADITGDGSVIAMLIVLGLGFGVGLAGVWLVVKYIHKKTLLQLVTGRPRFDLSRYFVAMGVAFVLSLVMFLIDRFIFQVDMTFERPGMLFVGFVVVALVLVPIQSGFEEVVYRGYLMQGFMLLTRNKAVLALVTGVLFAVTHLSNPEASTYGIPLYVTALTVSGIFHALLVLFDGGLELAAGYHMMNNLFMGVVSNTEGAVIETPALFTIHEDSYELFPNLVLEIVVFAVAILALNFKYKWFRLGVGRGS